MLGKFFRQDSMRSETLSYSSLPQLAPTDLAHIQGDDRLKNFQSYSFDTSGLLEALNNRKFDQSKRELLHSVILKQYNHIGLTPPSVLSAILDENTFTITTAHQPSLLTGPLYNIFKICSTIHLGRLITTISGDKKVLPVFLINGEDHDWNEINHFHLFGKKYSWDKSISGPVGRIDLEGLQSVVDSVLTVLEREPHIELVRGILNSSLEGVRTYAQFHQKLLSLLFGNEDLIVLNSDDPELKGSFAPVMRKEIQNHFIHSNVETDQESLRQNSFKTQAYSREVNLFYMEDGLRERLEPAPEGLMRVDSKQILRTDELDHFLDNHPERFSPNVLLRPLYQEHILPNIAYVGGGGEIAYWFETRSAFREAGIDFPVLVRRNSLALTDESVLNNLKKLNLTWQDLSKDIEYITKQYLQTVSSVELDYSEELSLLENAFQKLAEKAKLIDPTLQQVILAESTKAAKQFEQLSSRITRSQKHQEESSIKKIQKLKDKLFPQNGLQERYENFLPYLSKYGTPILQDLIQVANPLQKDFILLVLQQEELPEQSH